MSTHHLSNIRVGRRLGLAFRGGGRARRASAPAPALLAVARAARPRRRSISAVDRVVRDAETARFQIADVTGWQGLVVSDAAIYGPEVALADDAYNRSGLLESKARHLHLAGRASTPAR